MVRSLVSVALLGLVVGASVSPASALTTKDCSVKYQAAKQAGTLGGKTWNDFRKAECGAEATPAAATTTVPNPVAPGGSKTSTAPAAPAPAAPAAVGAAGYPARVDPKYASEPAGKQRMHTCLDSYNAAKAAGTLGGAKWIQKGGGYYSECNKRLKG
jgi:hypothetical protein